MVNIFEVVYDVNIQIDDFIFNLKGYYFIEPTEFINYFHQWKSSFFHLSPLNMVAIVELHLAWEVFALQIIEVPYHARVNSPYDKRFKPPPNMI